MVNEPQRLFEVRLLVSAVVNLNDAELIETLAAAGPTASIAEVVASEVASNLESVTYIDAVVVSRL